MINQALKQEYKYLKLINFSNVLYWAVSRFQEKELILTNKYPHKPFGYFLSKITTTKEQIKDENSYRIIGVRSYGLGAYINRTVYGKELTMRTYQLTEENQLLWCKVDTKNGAFGIVTKEMANSYASSNMALAEIDNSKILNEYLQLIFTSVKFTKYLDTFVSGTTNRKYIKQDELLSKIKIPLPKTLEEQKKIIDKYNEKIKLAEIQERRAIDFEKEAEEYLFHTLKIQILKKKQEEKNQKYLKFVNLKDLTRWGVKFLSKTSQSVNFLHSEKYQMKKLGRIVEIDPRTDFSNMDDDCEMSFLPMQCISDEYGEIIEQKKGIKSKSKGYTKFKEGDLIWAKITPCMQNGKSAIATNLLNGYGYGSTEFYVIRNYDKNVDLNFIYHILRTNIVRQVATSYFTGSAGQQRVPKSYLENLEIPLPDIEIQEEISYKLYEIKSEIKLLKQQAEVNRKLAKEEFEKELFE